MTGIEEAAAGYVLYEAAVATAQLVGWMCATIAAAVAGKELGEEVAEAVADQEAASQAIGDVEEAAGAQPKAEPQACSTCGGGDDDGGDDDSGDEGTQPGQRDEVPEKAKSTRDHVREHDGAAPDGYEGGRTFRNREGRLPDGQYREYDVDPRIPGQSRNAERIVIEQTTGKSYYTPDHYKTFIPF